MTTPIRWEPRPGDSTSGPPSLLCRVEMMDITSVLEKIDRIANYISDLETERKELIDALPDHVESFLGKQTIKTIQAAADDLYWASPLLATPTKKAFRKMFGNQFRPSPRSIDSHCSACGDPCPNVPIESWTDAKFSSNRCSWKYCQSCKERDRKKNKHQASTEKTIHRLKTMPYSQYLKTDHWNMIRRDALARSRYRCQLCNSQEPLQVHHRTYERRGQEIPSDVIALCQSCHEKHHDIQRGEDI